METIIRPLTWADFPNAARPRYEALRGPAGEQKVLEENFFIDQALFATVLSGLRDEDHAAYAAPYPTPASRRPLLAWPREMPIDGEPADVVAHVEGYDAWLASSPEVPKLLLTFDGTEDTLMIGTRSPPERRAHRRPRDRRLRPAAPWCRRPAPGHRRGRRRLARPPRPAGRRPGRRVDQLRR